MNEFTKTLKNIRKKNKKNGKSNDNRWRWLL